MFNKTPKTMLKRPLNATCTSALAIATLAVVGMLNATPAAADRTYWGGGAGQFEDVVREHGRRVGEGARTTSRRAWDAVPNVVRRGATSSAITNGARRLGVTAGRATAIGQGIGFFAFPNCAGEDC